MTKITSYVASIASKLTQGSPIATKPSSTQRSLSRPLARRARACRCLVSAQHFEAPPLYFEKRLLMSIFPLGLSQILEAEGEDAGLGRGGLRIQDAKARRLCGRRPGFFPWPRTRDAASLQSISDGVDTGCTSGGLIEGDICRGRPCAALVRMGDRLRAWTGRRG